jgi:hypothetical protein
MFPHERSLVKRLEGKPFVLIGVNSDSIPADQLKKKNEDAQITWRSFKNDRGARGAISDAFGVQGWPTIYVIDHKGTIRHKWVGSPADKVLDDAIETLVKDAEGGAAKKDAK